MGDIRVVNRKHLGDNPLRAPQGVVRVIVHRGSPLGNPFKMYDYGQKERDRVCDEYESWLYCKLLQPGAELRQFQELLRIAEGEDDLELVCFCSPKRCHGDTIKKLLEGELTKGGG